jgi:hypothetical protein
VNHLTQSRVPRATDAAYWLQECLIDTTIVIEIIPDIKMLYLANEDDVWFTTYRKIHDQLALETDGRSCDSRRFDAQ